MEERRRQIASVSATIIWGGRERDAEGVEKSQKKEAKGEYYKLSHPQPTRRVVSKEKKEIPNSKKGEGLTSVFTKARILPGSADLGY